MTMAAPLYAAEMGIAVVVNDGAISVDDLNDRMRLVVVSSRLPNTKDTREKLAPQIINGLVEEELKLQEAQRLELSVSQGEINKGFATIAQQNNIEADEFKAALKKSGINIATMERQIRSQIAWTKIVQGRLRPKVNISENDIDNVLERLRGNEGKTEYLAAEIYLPVETPEEESQIRDLARKLTQQIRGKKTPFSRLAQQFSKAPGAVKGGDLGWIQNDQMMEELGSAIVKLEKGSITDPIRTPGGYHILLLRDTRVIAAENFPNRDQISMSLGLQRLERLQQRYFLDLKATAFIEDRLGS